MVVAVSPLRRSMDNLRDYQSPDLQRARAAHGALAADPLLARNTQLPWTEVLDYACRWAFLTTTPDAAAARITRSVYDLGPTVVEYDCPGGGSTRYAAPNFNCTAFLE